MPHTKCVTKLYFVILKLTGQTATIRFDHLNFVQQHTCVKEDLKRSAVELVYGTKLRLPDAFPSLNQTTTENEDEFAENLQKWMDGVSALKTRQTKSDDYSDDE